MQEAIEYLKKRRGRKYTAQDIRELKLFPWATSDRTITKVIERDAYSGENILHAQIHGEGRQRRYYIEGANIMKFVTKYGPALMPGAKPKQHEKNKKEEAKPKHEVNTEGKDYDIDTYHG